VPLSKAEFATLAGDGFLNFDGLETCNFYRRVVDGQYEDAVEFTGLGTKGDNEDEDFVSRVAPGRNSQIWHGLVREMGEVHVRDRVEDSEDRLWEIWRVQKQTLGSRYRLTCVELHESVR